MDIHIFTDGACSGNPGKGGYGVIMTCLIKGKQYTKELSQGFQKTTNNRMELLAVIVALEALKKPGNNVIITSDSKYVVDAVEKGWLNSWVKNEFKSRKNKDLWLRYIEAAKNQKVKFEWIKGHSLHKENERCDKMAVESYKKSMLMIDANFEGENPADNSPPAGESIDCTPKQINP